MTKYYRVIKENPIWEIGAILRSTANCKGYAPIEDIWNKVKDWDEYLSSPIIEGQPEYFERVYKSQSDRILFLTKGQMKQLCSNMHN